MECDTICRASLLGFAFVTLVRSVTLLQAVGPTATVGARFAGVALIAGIVFASYLSPETVGESITVQRSTAYLGAAGVGVYAIGIALLAA